MGTSVRIVALFSLVAEASTAAVVLLAPARFSTLLFGAAVEWPGAAFTRLVGIALLALVVACWPAARPDASNSAAVRGITGYNLLAAAYLAYEGAASGHAGVLLWPAVLEHALVGLVLATKLGSARSG